MKEGGIFKADAEYNERKNKNEVYRDKMRVLLFFSEMIIPLILFYVVGFGVLMKCDIYEEFVKGAKEGLETVIQILPTLIGLMVAVGVLRASGFLTMLGEVLGKVTEPFGFPSALVPLTIVRMFSSSAATGLLLDVFREFGTDSRNRKNCFYYDVVHGNNFLHSVGVLYGSKNKGYEIHDSRRISCFCGGNCCKRMACRLHGVKKVDNPKFRCYYGSTLKREKWIL